MSSNNSVKLSWNQWLGRVVVVTIVVVTGIALWQTDESGRNSSRVAIVRTPVGVMGTTCTLVAVVPRGHESIAQQGLENAERALRDVDALMSTYLDKSEVSIVNLAAAGSDVPLSQPTLDVVAASRDYWRVTDGAFDATCRPLIDIWRQAGRDDRKPTDEERVTARDQSSWADFEILDGGLRKFRTSARLDLGGVAKGYGIDHAFEAIEAAGCDGILVDVGGDVRVGGRDDRGEKWKVVVRDPFGASTFASFELEAGAVCTSGNYERFVEIDGVRYSHIVDPRNGFPARRLPSVTVVADDAMSADVWATALSVLGPAGLDGLPEGIEALLVEGDEFECQVRATPAIRDLVGGLPAPPCRRTVE